MRLWIAAAGLIGIAALGLAAVPGMVDWNSYRPDIETAAIELSGHDVTISGPITMTLLPRPVLTFRDMTLSGRTEDAIGFKLSANQAEATLEVGPLLAGRPVVQGLRLKRPVLSVDDNNSRRLSAWPPKWRDWSALFQRLDLETIEIADGWIEIAEDGSARDFSLRDISMQLQIGGPDGPLEAAGLFKTKRHEFTVTAAFGRSDRNGVRSAKVQIDARNGVEETTALGFSGRLANAGDDEGLSGRVTLSGPDLQHGLAAISAATGYPSTFLSLAEAQPFAIEGRIDVDQAGMRSEDLQLKLSDKLGKGRIDLQLHPQTRLDLGAELPAFRLADDAGLSDFLPLDLLSKLRVPPGEIDIRLRELIYRGEAARKGSLTLKTGSDWVTKVEQAKVQLPGLVDLAFEGGLYAGEIGPRLEGKLAAVGDDLASTLAWLGLLDGDGGGRGWRGFSLESAIDVSSVEIALSAIDMRLDSSKLQGDASLRFSERRHLTLDADVERPNLDLYGDGGDMRALASGLADGLKAIDAEIDARFKRVNWQGLHLEEGEIAADADQGKLTLRRIVAKTIGDTELSVSGEIDLQDSVADVTAELQSEHPVRALRHLEVPLPLTSSRPRALKLSGGMNGTFESFALKVEADYDEGSAVVEGEAGWTPERPWYDLTLSARHPDHQALASQFGLAPLVASGDARGALGLAGRLRHKATTPWIASGSVQLGPTTMTGSLAFRDGSPDGPFEAKLSVGAPQKDSLAPFLILSGIRLTGDWTPARWLGRLPTIGLSTAWLDKAEGTISLASKGGLAGDGLTMEARLADGLLYVEQLEASPWQGQMQAEITLEQKRDQPFLAVAVDLDQVEAADFATWLGVKSGLSGPLDIDVEASTFGRTPYQLMAGLSGEMTIRAGPGEIRGLGVPGLRKALLPVRSDDVAIDRALSLQFNEIDAKAGLSRGVLSFEDSRLALGSTAEDDSAFVIEGSADLLLWVLDLALRRDTESEEATAPSPVYRLFGPPDRPAAVTAAGN
ncbi:MAG: AsmA family protein [Pseudomonadota bacterium]